MRLEDVTAEIRPRSDWEAADLGLAMARRDFWRCIATWWLAVLVPTVIGIVLLQNHPFIFVVLFWWWRPAGSRMVLFELSRRLFGEKPKWKQVWPELPRAWWRRFGYRFLWARFSPWTPLTMAVEDLEGLRGKSYGQRSRLLLRRGDGACFRLALGGSIMAVWLTIGMIILALKLMPEGRGGVLDMAWEALKEGEFTSIPLVASWFVVGCYMICLSLTDVFVTGGGFGIYVNNRTWIEGWDVELAFKRLVNRIGKAAIILLACVFTLVPVSTQAAERAPDEVIKEVKANPDFEVHKRQQRVSKPTTSSSSPSSLPDWWGVFMRGFGNTLLVLCAAAVLFGIAWLIWHFRHVFQGKSGPGRRLDQRPTARVVMGMEVSPDSLPEDIPTTAWRWWTEGKRHEALALLYRGAISKAIELARVEIAESDTEGDCLRRVKAAGEIAHPGYFTGLTGSWIGLAYARTLPADAEVESLCRQWPYVVGRRVA